MFGDIDLHARHTHVTHTHVAHTRHLHIFKQSEWVELVRARRLFDWRPWRLLRSIPPPQTRRAPGSVDNCCRAGINETILALCRHANINGQMEIHSRHVRTIFVNACRLSLVYWSTCGRSDVHRAVRVAANRTSNRLYLSVLWLEILLLF